MNVVDAGLHPNVVAFKRVVREKESNQIDSGPTSAYTLVNGGAHFTDFTDHPYAGLSTAVGGRAAGVAQFLPSTWGDMKRAYVLPDFSPASQEIAFTGCITKRNALDDVIAGRFDDAVAKCRPEWTSLPGASESRTSWTLEKARAVYEKWGGQYGPAATQAPAPIEDHSEPYVGGADNSDTPAQDQLTSGDNPVPLILSLLPSVLQLFAPRAQAQLQKVTGATPDVVAQFAQTVMDKLQQATGTTDPLQAVAAITKNPDPAIVQQVEDHALDYLDKLGPVLDKIAGWQAQAWSAQMAGQDAAAKRAQGEKWDMTKMVVLFAGVTTTLMVLALLAAVIWPVVIRDADPNTALLALAGPLFMASIACWKDIFAYRFDGTKESGATNAALAAVAQSKAT